MIGISIARVLAPAQAENVGKKVVFKNCAPFTDCISEINNTQIDNAKYIGVIMPMYNLIEHKLFVISIENLKTLKDYIF